MSKARIGCALCLGCWLMMVQPTAGEESRNAGPYDAPEQTWVLGLGGAADFDFERGTSSRGVNVFVEYPAIAGVLEIEFGASSLAQKTGRELAYNLFFKTPIWSRRDLEVAIAGGPELVQFTGMRDSGNFPGVGLAIDVMYWPTPHFGFYVEPTFEVVFRHGTETALDLNAGVLVGW